MKSLETLIGFLAIQLATVVWWASRLTARVKALETGQAKLDAVPERLASIEAILTRLDRYNSQNQ